MMREIKFRGRDIETGEWRYGFYYVESAPLVAVGKKKKDKHYIVFPGFADWNMPRMNQAEVCPGSIGQFTGLLDKNGVEIWEGDVVEFNVSDGANGLFVKDEIMPVSFYEGMFCFEEGMAISNYLDYITVIGNIYEHGDLLK